MEKELKKLDESIQRWEGLIKEYPLAISYKKILKGLQQRRCDLADSIGRKR